MSTINVNNVLPSTSALVNVNGVYVGASASTLRMGASASMPTATSSVYIGINSGVGATGINNTALGYNASSVLSTGINNTTIGRGAGEALTTGNGNTYVGSQAGLTATTGSSNTCIGEGAGQGITTGGSNTFVGTSAGQVASFTGIGSICIGASALPSTSSASYEITLGNNSIGVLRCAVTSITSLSDGRDKSNIEDSTYGLELVNSLKPVTFEWETRDGAKTGVKDLGFIAQDLQEVDDDYLNLVYDNNPERLEASYGRLMPVLVKAIQELSEKVENLENN